MREQFALALQQPWDLVISDYHLPGFSGLDVKSDFFSVRGHARYRERHVRFEAYMQRGKGAQPAQRGPVVRLIGRSDSARMQG